MIKGIGASKGIAIGKVFIKKTLETTVEMKKIEDVEAEKEKFYRAVEEATKELEHLYATALEKVGEEEAQIFQVHQMLLEDLDYQEQVIDLIMEKKLNVTCAISEASVIFAEIFEQMEDPYMRERAADIKDISKRLINILNEVKEKSLADINEACIIIAKELFPSDTIQMNKRFVLGFITEVGGKMSHSAILARTMQIPAVVGAEEILKQVEEEDVIVIDGKKGEIHINPSPEELEKWQQKKLEYALSRQALEALKGTANQTKDGLEIKINGNIGEPSDIKAVLENDAKGIGLFRSEFLYMNGNKLPTEEEQFNAYKTVLEGMSENVIIRTLDVGGDKAIPYLNIPKEDNPFLGYRAIRVCLDQVEMFKTQIRALLRASIYGKLGIMFPMIATLEEIRRAKQIVEEVKKSLRDEKIAFSEDIEIGMMVETPAAVMLSDLFAKEVDFFSIGTNDLTQYILAVDRMNGKIANLYDTSNLAVLRSIKIVAENAHKAGIWVGICGEAAADTNLTEFFVGVGIDELSVSAGSILEVRKQIQSIDSKEAIHKFMD